MIYVPCFTLYCNTATLYIKLLTDGKIITGVEIIQKVAYTSVFKSKWFRCELIKLKFETAWYFFCGNIIIKTVPVI